jgi:mRNA interferase MazF
MQVQVARWGNSLGLRIPKDIALRTGLREGARVEVEAEGDRIIISPARPRYVLADLLKGMTPEAMREAFDWGPDKGREIVEWAMPYAPEAGDLIWADFDPRVGREQSGRRPALVVSPAVFCRVTEFAIVCPITSRVRPFGTSVVLPTGLPVSGEILTSHVRSIDTLARPISYAGAAVPAEVLHEVRMKLAALIGL